MERERSPLRAQHAPGRFRDALWSVYFHWAQLSPSLVPPEACPMRLDDAMVSVAAHNDEHRSGRALMLLVRLAKLAGYDFLDLLDAVVDRTHASFRLNVEVVVAKLTDALAPVADALQIDVTPFVPLSYALFSPPKPCVKPAVKISYPTGLKTTQMRSWVTANRELDETLLPLLDPRGWSRCSTLFKRTYRVIDAGTDYPRHDGPEPIGSDWSGLMYELAEVGPQTVENVLSIDFRVVREANRIDAVEVRYGLYESLSYQFGALALPGVMQQNWGVFRATPSPRGQTEIYSEKTVNFARVTGWSAMGLFDYGEVLNYMAPALLTLWIDDLQLTVPCCRRPLPPYRHSSEDRYAADAG